MPLPDWIIIIILGAVEGATEFIPVSSTGHLLIFQEWLDYRQSDLFTIVIQSGAVLAVLPLFTQRLRMMADWRNPESLAFNLKIFVGFVITVIGGLTLDKLGIELPDTLLPVAGALILGGIVFIVVEKKLRNQRLSDHITWPVVFMVASAQILAAVFPGTSRSGATIIFAMLCGLNRPVATEFSFLIGIPTLLAAGAYKILKALNAGVEENWGLIFLGTIVSAGVSFIAVKWLLRYVQSHSFIGFGVYRILLGLALLWMFYESSGFDFSVQNQSSMNSEKIMDFILWNVGGWFFGIIIGILVFRVVHPKTKSTRPVELAKCWLAWGLMASISTGISYLFRKGGTEGIAGCLLSVFSYSVIAWILGWLWGVKRFGWVQKNDAGQTVAFQKSRRKGSKGDNYELQ